jgi:spermidine synthase
MADHTLRGLAAAVALLLAMSVCRADSMRLLHSERSLYREVLVYENSNVRCMCFTRHCRIGRQSCMDVKRPDRMVMHYPQMMMGALYVRPAPGSVLIIGLGGGTLPRALVDVTPGVRIDVVEIDAAVVRVAKQYFAFRESERVRIHTMDGRVFVKRAVRARERYDLIMLDAFDHEYIPEHLLTQEFLREVKSLLAPEGVLAANTFAGSRLYHHESTTYASVFPRFFNLKRDNRVIIAVNGSLPDEVRLQANSAKYDEAFAPFGFGAAQLLPLFSRRQDWKADARVLTDQYSPANLLNMGE